jgi:hypothetical protein
MNDSNPATPNMAELAERIAAALNALGMLAAPMAARRYGSFPPKEQILARINDLHEIAMSGNMELQSKGPLSSCGARIGELTALLEAWVPSVEVPVAIRQTAQNVLIDLGFPTPDEGWEVWHGGVEYEPTEPLTPDPLPPPTQEELAARPHGYFFAVGLEWLKWMASPKMIAKVPPADLARPSIRHIDSIILSFRPFRSEYASSRMRFRSMLAELEQMRKDCIIWNGTAPVPLPLQEAARRIVLALEFSNTIDQVVEYDVDVEPWVLEPPPPKAE